jgi:hypothetical protein
MNDTYKAKNADYGDSFSKLRKEYPEAICVRLMDKLERLKTLMKGNEQQVKDESIKDTLLDLANYAIMELVEIEADPVASRVIKCNDYIECQGCPLLHEGKCAVGILKGGAE